MAVSSLPGRSASLSESLAVARDVSAIRICDQTAVACTEMLVRGAGGIINCSHSMSKTVAFKVLAVVDLVGFIPLARGLEFCLRGRFAKSTLIHIVNSYAICRGGVLETKPAIYGVNELAGDCG
jgi:hypothetical protein